MRIAGATGPNQAGLAVIERGGRIGALRSGHEPSGSCWMTSQGRKIFDRLSQRRRIDAQLDRQLLIEHP